MDALSRDTIAALSTPPGRSGIAIVRVSGPRALSVACRRMRGHPEPSSLRHGRVRVVWLEDLAGTTLDQGLVLTFRAPHSYTGEDLVEFHLHGSPVIVESLLADIAHDAALALPGEFTRRAVENSRLSLDQAEAVLGLIEARSPLAHKLSLRALAGEPGRRMRDMRQQLVELVALVEAELDFAEHEITPTPIEALRDKVFSAHATITGWAATYRLGRLAQGVNIVLAGAPNAGKSTLMNALLGEQRVLVDPSPGTTRDSVSHQTRLGALDVVLWDTAGLRDSSDRVEQLGVAMTQDLLSRADLILHLVAPGQHPDAGLLHDARCLTVLTMSDREDFSAPPRGALAVSARTGHGLGTLREQMLSWLVGAGWEHLDLVVTEARHHHLLERGAEALQRAGDALAGGVEGSCVAADLRDAADALGEVLGEKNLDEIYPLIFSRFCIGK